MKIKTMRSAASCVSIVLGAVLCVMSAPVSAAETPPLPNMTVMMGGQQVNPTTALAWNYDAAADKFSLAGPATWEWRGGAGEVLASFAIGNAEAVPDPVLFFAGSAVNNTGAPLAYSFSFNTPLVPNLLGLVDSHAELGLSLTDGLNNGATVQPTVPGGKMLTSFDLYSNGTPITKNVDIGDLFSILSGTGTTTFAKDGSLTCTQACVTMSALMAFTLTAQDSASFSGKVVQVSVVPVPAAAWLFGSGLIGLAGLRKRAA